MLVVHMDSGLGNQMLDYVEYLAVQRMNPGKRCLIETLIYDIPQQDGMFSMWNGYELKRIFGIDLPDIRNCFDERSWAEILKKVQESRFWEENWNYAPYIVKALSEAGMCLTGFGSGAGYLDSTLQARKSRARQMLTAFFQTEPGYHTKRLLRKAMSSRLIEKNKERYQVYREYPDNSLVGHSLAFKFKGFGIEAFDAQIREAFRFPEIEDARNREMQQFVRNTNSVAIHARRSDLLFVNGYCYRYGYFRRAVHYIKRKVPDPVFVFFTDEKSIGWCEQNEGIFGLDFKKDTVKFVTWNTGTESYRDMQLMAECRHNIFTESTFGFWGAYLNTNPDKITCAPDCTMLATNTF